MVWRGAYQKIHCIFNIIKYNGSRQNNKHMSRKILLILIISAIILIAIIIIGLYLWQKPNMGEQAEEQDQTGTEDYTKDWKTFTGPVGDSTFKYPEVLSTRYIFSIDWPPQVQILEGPFICTEAGEATDRAGKTEERTINSRIYCVTEVTEGAAGSIYTQYAYAFQTGNKAAILNFSLRLVQCGNYSKSERQDCENERETFNIDGIIDQIAQTFTLTSENNTQSNGIIKGTVFLGPTCPIQSIPPDPACADKPYQTRLAVTKSDQVQAIKEFDSDVNGKFVVEILPGEYIIYSAAAANILSYCASSGTIKVGSGETVETTIFCDTGIR